MSIALTDNTLESRSTELLRTALRLSTLALAAVAIAANFTDYGPLIPLLQHELHVTLGATGLLSTLLYVGIGLSSLPEGWLADRYGAHRVLFGALLLVEAGGCLLPVIPDLVWIVLCRFVIGQGAGAAIVAGSQAARGGKYAAFGQGLFGGAMQVGAGLGQAIAPWLAVYFALSYGLPLDLSAMLGAVGLLAGMLFRSLGGMLLSRKVFTHCALMRAGTAQVSAGHIGAESALGPGTAQGVVSVISAPASAFEPPLIGALLGQHGNFAFPFGAMVLVGVVALIASLFVGPIVVRTRGTAELLRLRAQDGDAYLAQTRVSGSPASLSASTLPSIVTLGAFAQGDATIIHSLQHAGGLPLLLPPQPSPSQGEAGDLLTDKVFFREIFDRRIWPPFCLLLLGQTRGLCLIEESQEAEETNGTLRALGTSYSARRPIRGTRSCSAIWPCWPSWWVCRCWEPVGSYKASNSTTVWMSGRDHYPCIFGRSPQIVHPATGMRRNRLFSPSLWQPARKFGTDLRSAEQRELAQRGVPLARLGEPWEVGEAVLYLAAATFCTETILNISGGNVRAVMS
jgi:MFS family permease